MAKRKNGRDVHGWLLVDKPEGVTSTQVVARARWAFGARKAGHAGTLDPLATGLLAVAFGEATKTVPFAQDCLKTYQFRARWGISTTTDDREGTVTKVSDRRPSLEQITSVLDRFTGEIMQVPPIYSAIKVDGRRAYDLARAGEDVSIKARPIHIERLDVLAQPDSDHADFKMVCGKGGYVRSMARDLGEALGIPAHVDTLRRIGSGGFHLRRAIGWEALEALRGDEDAADAWLLPVAAGLSDLPRISVTRAVADRLRHGDARAVPPWQGGQVWVSFEDVPVAILEWQMNGPTILRILNLR